MIPPGRSAVTTAYLEHFSPRDLELLRSVGRHGAQSSDPGSFSLADGLETLLGSPELFETVFAAPRAGDPLLSGTPFFVFAVAVHRAAAQLQSVSYVSEWLGLGRRAPVFDVGQLREFMAPPRHRLFLAELLASYTHVASGSVMVATRRGLRRQRFSELDPVRLAGLLEVVSREERPGILRRMGDLALFLTGVFPDYVARRGFGPIEEGRLLRAGSAAPDRSGDVPSANEAAALGDRGAVGLLEQLGRRWYRAAFELLPSPVAENVRVLGELPEHFDHARRILGFVTEELLFPHRDRWFGVAGG
jgi:hypothetical protein